VALPLPFSAGAGSTAAGRGGERDGEGGEEELDMVTSCEGWLS
jgi:hypothetical protein